MPRDPRIYDTQPECALHEIPNFVLATGNGLVVRVHFPYFIPKGQEAITHDRVREFYDKVVYPAVFKAQPEESRSRPRNKYTIAADNVDTLLACVVEGMATYPQAWTK